MKKTYQNAKRLTLLLLSFMMLSYVHGQIVITGTVMDGEFGGGLPGANVVVQGSNTGTSTDIDGKYSIKVPDGSATLVFSSIGFASQKIKVGDKKIIDLTLKKDVKQIEEVVKVGYGSQKKTDVTGAVTQLAGSDIADRPVIGVDQAMQGKAAGVAVTANSGSPGADAMVRIRGTGSINNADPLYVVDGIPSDGTPKINPTEIKSISVLKDASACAIYGSRAAGGVILITTREGKMGNKRSADCPSTSTSEISFDAYYGVQRAQKFVNVTNAADFVNIYTKSGNILPINRFNETLDLTGKGTDWQKQVFRAAPTQRYTLAYETGSDNSSMRISGSLINQQGIVKGSDYTAMNFGGRGTHNLKKWLTVGETFGFSSQHTKIIDQSPNFYANNPVLLSLIMDPTVSPNTDKVIYTDPQTGLSTNYNNAVYNSVRNPLRCIDLNNQKNANISTSGSFYIEITPLKNLVLRSQVGSYLYNNVYSNYTPSYVQDPSIASFNNTSNPYYNVNTSKGWSYTITNTAQYMFNIMRKSDSTKVAHNFLFLLGNETYYNRYDAFEITAYNLQNSLASVFPHIGEASTDSIRSNPSTLPSEISMVSMFGRVNYAFRDKFLVTSNIRYDWCSRFVKGNRLGIFPSFSTGYKISEEDFFKNNEKLKNINELKIRVGWGEIGNSFVQDAQGYDNKYPFSSNMSDNSQFRSYSFNGKLVPGQSVGTIPNAKLKWETTTQWNAGFDMSILHNKVTLTVDAFHKQTYNMIVTLPIPLIAGGEFGDTFTRTSPAVPVNAGSVVNDGIEASLAYRGEIAMKHKLTYDVGGNIAWVANKVGDIGGITIPGVQLSTLNFAPNLTKQGYGIANFYGYKVEGLYQSWSEINKSPIALGKVKPGDLKFQDTDGDGKITDKDKVFLGSPLPKLTYGFFLSGGMGAFDFNMSFQGSYGNKIFNATKYFLDGNASGSNVNNYSTRRLNAWSETNTSSSEPRLGADAQNYNVASSIFIEDGSYLRLKDITIGFTLPSTIVKKMKINKLRVYAQIQNALTITKYSGFDPEVGLLGSTNGNVPKNNTSLGVDLGTYPQARIFMGGINFSF